MKTTGAVIATIRARLTDTWAPSLTCEAAAPSWPYRISLGRPSTSDLTDRFTDVLDWALAWQDWARTHGTHLETTQRRAGGSIQTVPTHITVADIDTAAHIAGDTWAQTITNARTRLEALRTHFPDHQDLAPVLRGTIGYSDTDFELLISAAHWFCSNPHSGLSPRQVPLEGIHAKWIDGHTSQLARLAGLETLGLADRVRPNPIHFTYLDPQHRREGGQVHDAAFPGWPSAPEYQPRVLIITENKDTAVLFPERSHAISMQGGGSEGPALISRIPWVLVTQRVLYWGDLDARGFEIVSHYRARGVPVETFLMDADTLRRYERFRSTHDAKGRLKRSARQPLQGLTPTEREAYELLTEEGWDGPVRIEQERIPLAVAAAAVSALLER